MSSRPDTSGAFAEPEDDETKRDSREPLEKKKE